MQVVLFAPGTDIARRVPVLACADALRQGASVTVAAVDDDEAVDAALAKAAADDARLVVAGGDGPLRAVLRRMVRRSLPRAGDRSGLADDRTVPDLPPVGLLPLDLVGENLVTRLGTPTSPAEVAAAVLGGVSRRVDLLRNDGGSVTIHGALLGSVDAGGRPVGWRATIYVDEATLTTGDEALIACAVANADGYTSVAGLPLVVGATPTDGTLDVGVALPAGRRGRIEVRRARGRAVSITPADPEVPYTDDGVRGTLTRGRTWWMERAAWAVYVNGDG